MANPEHLKILKQGVDVWNQWREENPDIRPDLNRENFEGQNLTGYNLNEVILNSSILVETDLSDTEITGADLRMCNLMQANFERSSLNFSNLSRTILTDVILVEAELEGAACIGSNLTNANLTGAYLSGVDFCGSIFDQADLSHAIMSGTKLSNVRLDRAVGLETIIHYGPSYLSLDIVSRSENKLPLTFLRGIGMPEIFIQYLDSLTEKAFEFYSCFISYSSKDKDFAERLYVDLQNKGVRCWYAPKDMMIGDRIRDRIDQSIRVHDKLLLILSEHSINSEWVGDEFESASEQEQSRGNTVLFPIRLDNAVMDTEKAWAAKLRRSRHIGDFTKWKNHDSYQKAFDSLLRDLKSEGE